MRTLGSNSVHYVTLTQQNATLQDLVDHIKSELSGDFEKVMVALMMSQAEYDAHLVREAVKGLGTDEDLLIEVLCTRSNAELEAAKEVYKKGCDITANCLRL